MKSYSPAIYSFLMLIFFSCARETSCALGGLDLAITGLNHTVNDTIIVIAYRKNTSFTEVVSERQYIFHDTIESGFILENDTLYLHYDNNNWHSNEKNNPGFIRAMHDYQIKTKNHAYFFKNMVVSPKTKKCGGLLSLECPDCYSPVVKFNLQGSTIIVEPNNEYHLEF